MAQQAVQQAKEAGRNEAYANIQAKKELFRRFASKTNSAKSPEQQIIEGILGAGTGGFADCKNDYRWHIQLLILIRIAE